MPYTYKELYNTESVLRSDDATLTSHPPGQYEPWDEYLAWLDAGNTPEPADPPAPIFFLAGLIAADVRTTDATPTELYRMTLPALTGVACDLVLIGVDTGNGATRIQRSSYAAKRLNAGAVGIAPAQIHYANHTDTGASSWAITPSIDGNDLVMSVTGAAGRTIDWSLSGSITTFTPSGR